MTNMNTNEGTTNNMKENSNNKSKKRIIKGILFDMDGTLIETETLGCKAVYLTLKDIMSDNARQEFIERNYLMPWDIKQQTLGLPGPDWSKLVIEYSKQYWGVTDNVPTVDEFLSIYDQHLMNLIDTDLQPCTYAIEIIDKLKNEYNLPMAIATSSHSKSLQHKRKKPYIEENIFSKMDIIITTDDPTIKNGKPAPDIYIEAAKRINVDPKHCIVFEDGMPGVIAGKAAGCYVVAVPDPRFTINERKQFENIADLVINDLSQFDISSLIT